MIPVRSFTRGKSRLAGSFGSGPLGVREHEAFVRGLADRAVAAAAPYPTAIVTSAPEVVEWAAARDLAVVADGGSLARAAGAGRAWAQQQGCARVVVVHADLPDIVTLDAVTGDSGDGTDDKVAVIVPCHRGDGTPVLSVPVSAPFRFSSPVIGMAATAYGRSRRRQASGNHFVLLTVPGSGPADAYHHPATR